MGDEIQTASGSRGTGIGLALKPVDVAEQDPFAVLTGHREPRTQHRGMKKPGVGVDWHPCLDVPPVRQQSTGHGYDDSTALDPHERPRDHRLSAWQQVTARTNLRSTIEDATGIFAHGRAPKLPAVARWQERITTAPG